MDDKSRQQMDELAELYLTGAVEDTPSNDTEAPSPIEGPEPIRLAPKAGGGDPTPTTDEPASDFDEYEDGHPVLRLTDGETDNIADEPSVSQDATQGTKATTPTGGNRASTSPQTTAPPRAALEAVLIGNLPGMSGPWLTQYAQLLAQTDGPVALLHVGDNAIDLEIVEPRAEAEPAPPKALAPVRIPPMREGLTGLLGLLDALVRSETSPARTVLVRIDADADAQTLSRLAAIDDWTVLCGSDDASIAGAGQTLRTLVRADPRLADRNIGLMVMGSDEQAARQAGTRIASDLQDDLVNPVELIGHLKRMQPVQVREIGSFNDPVSIWPQLVSWFDTLEMPEPLAELTSEPPADTAPAETPVQPEAKPAAAQAEDGKPQRLSPQAAKLAAPPVPNTGGSSAAPRPTFRPTPPRPRQSEQPRQARPAAAHPGATSTAPRSTPRPAPVARASQPTRPVPQPRVLAAQPELDLLALIAQGPGAFDATALDARLPDQPDTQLAVDHDGVVHILAQHDSAVSEFDTRHAVMQLIEAGRWVRQNLELLALTQRDLSFVEQDPVLHLLTDRADDATQLVGRLAGQVRLHLLQQVQVGSATGWFCTPLG